MFISKSRLDQLERTAQDAKWEASRNRRDAEEIRKLETTVGQLRAVVLALVDHSHDGTGRIVKPIDVPAGLISETSDD